MNDYPIHFPASIDLQIYLRNDEGVTAVATVEYKPGKFVTKDEIRERIKEFERDDMPEGFRLMTKREVWDYIMQDMTGTTQRFAMPGDPTEFDN